MTMPKPNQTDEEFQRQLAAHRRAIFGVVIDLDNDDEWDDVDGELDAIYGNEITPKQIAIPSDDDRLMVAARQQWPHADRKYAAMIVHRYREMYVGIPEADAIRAILEGFGSPSAAMSARKLKRRPLKDRAP
jgi:hypothetical protein